MRHRLLQLFAAFAFTAGSAFATDGVTPNQILIGQSITLQGGKNDYGAAALAGVRTYIGQVNSAGGVGGRQIVLKTLDDDNNNDKAQANARELIEKDKVFILFGSIEGGPSNALMPVANAFKVPFFGPMAGSPSLRRPFQSLVYPVRAEHRDEFRALIVQAKRVGMQKVGFLRADSAVGEAHLANVRLICQELGVTLVADLPFKSDVSDAQLGQMVTGLEQTGAQMVFNHGSASVYEKLIRLARARGLRASFYGVNSGSTQLAKHLGELAHGMVFAQVVPSPWERKTAITREYQAAFAKAQPGQDFSYGSLEGYVTAKALVQALRLAGPNPTRESFLAGLQSAKLDLSGLTASYSPEEHQGLTFVDLAIVARDSKFRH
ncbi:ABC transporter substrate-binding protein [Rhodoferax sp. 4810]|nr:ABC transporter substrate-binding protein [Rhodoferax jenense]